MTVKSASLNYLWSTHQLRVTRGEWLRVSGIIGYETTYVNKLPLSQLNHKANFILIASDYANYQTCFICIMEVQELYRYEQLMTEGSIRLILLYPHYVLAAPLQCSLIHTTLEDCEYDLIEKYTALSYVWGDVGQRGKIFVNGTLLCITASLESALQHVRDPLKAIRIWADGICINQNDVLEKNQQVTQMGSVYDTAHHTIIFLGLGSQKSETFLRFVSSKHSQPFGGFVMEEWKLMLNDIFTRPWFERVWILQELVLSVDPWIQCGTIRIKWDRLHEFIIAREDFRSRFSKVLAPFQGMHKIRTNYKKSIPAQEPKECGKELLAILRARRGLGATDQRDLIYAHLGLMSPKIRQAIKVDYGKSCRDLYKEVAVQLLIWLPFLDMIALSGSSKQSSKVRGLPSWVPDWSMQLPPAEEEIRLQLSPKNPLPKNMFVSDYRILHTDSDFITLSNIRLTSVALILPDISPDHLHDLHGWNPVWEVQEDTKHRGTMLDLFMHMLSQTMPSQEVKNVIGVKRSNLSAPYSSIIKDISATIQHGKLWESTAGKWKKNAYEDAILDTLLMLRAIARMYLSGARVAVMTNGSIQVVPRCVEMNDMCTYHLRQEITVLEDWIPCDTTRPAGVQNLERYLFLSTFLRRDMDSQLVPRDIANVGILQQMHFDLSFELHAHKVLGTGEYPYTLTVSELQNIRLSDVSRFKNIKDILLIS